VVPIPTTYAGGASSLADLETVTRLGQAKVDLTIGSALDIFGGNGVRMRMPWHSTADRSSVWTLDAGSMSTR